MIELTKQRKKIHPSETVNTQEKEYNDKSFMWIKWIEKKKWSVQAKADGMENRNRSSYIVSGTPKDVFKTIVLISEMLI